MANILVFFEEEEEEHFILNGFLYTHSGSECPIS
jgi:hypothetical protein